MSLNFDLSAIKDKDNVCWIIAQEDFAGNLMCGAHKKGDHIMNPITEALIQAAMMVCLTDITEKNAVEWHVRLEMMVKLTGSGMFLGDKKNPSLEDIRKHIGLRTNVFPALTQKQWVKNYLANIILEDMFRMEKAAKVQEAHWVTELYGLRRTGRINAYKADNMVANVQFGADGPFDDIIITKLRPANKQEIAEKEGTR